MEFPTTPVPDMDQSRPTNAGFDRIPNFMDVRVYNDAAFQVFYEQDGWGRSRLADIDRKAPGDETAAKRMREVEFNSFYLDDSVAARSWNQFAEKWLSASQWKIQMRALDGWGDQRVSGDDGKSYHNEFFPTEAAASAEIGSYFAPPGGIDGSPSDFRAVPADTRSDSNFYD
jgi:hypothetical protein